MPHLPQPGGQWEPTEEQLQVGRRFIADRHAIAPLSHHTASAISAAREERGEEQRRAMLRRRLQRWAPVSTWTHLRSLGLGALAGSAGMAWHGCRQSPSASLPRSGHRRWLDGHRAVMDAAGGGGCHGQALLEHSQGIDGPHGGHGEAAAAQRSPAERGPSWAPRPAAGASLAAGTKHGIRRSWAQPSSERTARSSGSRKRALKDDDDDVGPLLA
jgi:hypothetical protein